jgi:hypothetical protein
MKSLFRVIVFHIIGLSFIACAPSVTATPSPIPSLTAITTATLTPIPTQTATATITPTPSPEYVPPTLIPTIDPTLVPELLSKAFSVQTLEGVNKHKIRQITGWNYGFGGESTYGRDPGYYWLDASHLLLYPRLGEQINGFSGFWEDVAYQPAIINLENGYVWLPEDRGVDWSSELGTLIVNGFKTSSEGDQREAVYIYTFDGQRTAYYWGKLTGVSPSRTKILIDNRWIDLKSGKMVAFEWDNDFDKDIDIYFPRPLWSSDETQVYTSVINTGMHTPEKVSPFCLITCQWMRKKSTAVYTTHTVNGF